MSGYRLVRESKVEKSEESDVTEGSASVQEVSQDLRVLNDNHDWIFGQPACQIQSSED